VKLLAGETDSILKRSITSSHLVHPVRTAAVGYCTQFAEHVVWTESRSKVNASEVLESTAVASAISCVTKLVNCHVACVIEAKIDTTTTRAIGNAENSMLNSEGQ
jgi:hypothetical protein